MSRVGATMPENLKKRLEKVSEKTGLGQAEIIRRGALEQINQLEDKADE